MNILNGLVVFVVGIIVIETVKRITMKRRILKVLRKYAEENNLDLNKEIERGWQTPTYMV